MWKIPECMERISVVWGLLSSPERFLVVICVTISLKRAVNSSLNLIAEFPMVLLLPGTVQTLPVYLADLNPQWYPDTCIEGNWKILPSISSHENSREKAILPNWTLPECFFNLTLQWNSVTLHWIYHTKHNFNRRHCQFGSVSSDILVIWLH